MTQKELQDLTTISLYLEESITVSKSRLEVLENFIKRLKSEENNSNLVFSKVSKSMLNAIDTFEDDVFKTRLFSGLSQIDSSLLSILLPIGIQHNIMFREKSIFSLLIKTIYNFYEQRRDIQDIFALRIILNSDIVPEAKLEKLCFSVEQVCTSFVRESLNARPIPCDKQIGILPYLKDYISFPKTNKYKSLHISYALLPDQENQTSRKFEIQIRTQEMEDIALNIAVHQKYKEKKYKSIWEALNISKLAETANTRFIEVGEIPGLISPIFHSLIS